LKDLIDQYKPNEADIDVQGNINANHLAEEANKLFTRLQNETTFVNFYQLAQVVKQFGDAWGFHLSTQNNTHLVCFYGKSSHKPYDTVVSPGCQ
jgi:hypothetical protein